MLWDHKKDIPSDPFNTTLDSLIDWLRTKPADGHYHYDEPSKCMLCQYLIDHGVQRPYVTCDEWGVAEHRPWKIGTWWISDYKGACMQALPIEFNDIARGRTWDGEAWTFGAALERAISVRDKLHDGVI